MSIWIPSTLNGLLSCCCAAVLMMSGFPVDILLLSWCCSLAAPLLLFWCYMEYLSLLSC